MMFIFKWIDDLVGKGIDSNVLIELFTYAALQTIPMALPLTILLSSIMTFGNLGEHYELVAMKSSGMSLQRIMFPLIITIILVCTGAFYFSNNILPVINLKAGSLLFDLREQKPALQIKESVFYNGIDGYSIRVGKKDPDGNTLYNLMIYDHTKGGGNYKVIVAESGTMVMSADKSFMILTLKNGSSYEEMIKNNEIQKPHPLMRNYFSEQIIRFDLTEFKLTRTDEELFKSNYQMMNIAQLSAGIDSLNKRKEKKKEDLNRQLLEGFNTRLSKKNMTADSSQRTGNVLEGQSAADKLRILEIAANIARSSKAYVESGLYEFKAIEDTKRRHEVEWHKKFTLSFACLVLFFIGAPLGAIIRKGGLGMPVVVSVIFFLIFHILNISGEKFAKEGVYPAYISMWIASAFLLPLGIFLTYKATGDSVIFDLDTYIQSIKKLLRKN